MSLPSPYLCTFVWLFNELNQSLCDFSVGQKLHRCWRIWAVYDPGTDFARPLCPYCPKDRNTASAYVNGIKKKWGAVCVGKREREAETSLLLFGREVIPILWVTVLRETRTPSPPHLSIISTHTHTNKLHCSPLLFLRKNSSLAKTEDNLQSNNSGQQLASSLNLLFSMVVLAKCWLPCLQLLYRCSVTFWTIK